MSEQALADALAQIDAAFGKNATPEMRAKHERAESERRLKLLREIRPQAKRAVNTAKRGADNCDIRGIDPFSAYVIARHIERESNDDNTPEGAWETLTDLALTLHQAAEMGELFGDPDEMLRDIDDEIAAIEAELAKPLGAI